MEKTSRALVKPVFTTSEISFPFYKPLINKLKPLFGFSFRITLPTKQLGDLYNKMKKFKSKLEQTNE